MKYGIWYKAGTNPFSAPTWCTDIRENIVTFDSSESAERRTCFVGSEYEIRPLSPAGYEAAGAEVGRLVEQKQIAYGDSFTKCAEFLELLYPNGVPVEAFTDMLCIVRIFDKLMRIATDKDALGESPYSDIAGYALLGLEKDKKK